MIVTEPYLTNLTIWPNFTMIVEPFEERDFWSSKLTK